MKKWKKVVLGTLAALLTVAVGIAIWQWENIRALYIYTSKTETELAQMAEENHQTTEEIIGKYDGITVKDISPEMEKALIQGEISVEEAIAAITNTETETTKTEDASATVQELESTETGVSEQQVNQNSAQQTTQDSQQQTTQDSQQQTTQDSQQQTTQNTTQKQPAVDKATQIINDYMEKIYIVKVNFLGRIGELAQEAKDEFYKFPLKERTKANKTATIINKLNECYDLESSCDAEIEALLSQLAAELTNIGADTSIVDEIRTAYETDKSVKKAYYMQLAF